jgi:hypothetical protein
MAFMVRYLRSLMSRSVGSDSSFCRFAALGLGGVTERLVSRKPSETLRMCASAREVSTCLGCSYRSPKKDGRDVSMSPEADRSASVGRLVVFGSPPEETLE